jgi:hypothetical protein
MSNLLDKVEAGTNGIWRVIKTIVAVFLLIFVIAFFFSMYSLNENTKIRAEQTAAQAKPSGDQITQAPQAVVPPVVVPPPAASLRLLSIKRVDNSLGSLSHAILKIEAVNQTGKTIKGMKLKFTVYDQFGDLVQSFQYKLEDRIEPTNGKIITTGIDLNQFREQDERLADLKDFKSSIEILEIITE